MNDDDANVDYGNSEEPRSMLESNASQHKGRKVEISKNQNPAISEEDEESRIEKRNSYRQQQQQRLRRPARNGRISTSISDCGRLTYLRSWSR